MNRQGLPASQIVADETRGEYTYAVGDFSITMPIAKAAVEGQWAVIEHCPRCESEHRVTPFEGTIVAPCGELYVRVDDDGPYLPRGVSRAAGMTPGNEHKFVTA